jgi:hypothetical protein
MRRAHGTTASEVSASEVSASKVPASKVPASAAVPSATSVLCQRDRSLQTGAGQHTGCNHNDFS